MLKEALIDSLRFGRRHWQLLSLLLIPLQILPVYLEHATGAQAYWMQFFQAQTEAQGTTDPLIPANEQADAMPAEQDPNSVITEEEGISTDQMSGTQTDQVDQNAQTQSSQTRGSRQPPAVPWPPTPVLLAILASLGVHLLSLSLVIGLIHAITVEKSTQPGSLFATALQNLGPITGIWLIKWFGLIILLTTIVFITDLFGAGLQNLVALTAGGLIAYLSLRLSFAPMLYIEQVTAQSVQQALTWSWRLSKGYCSVLFRGLVILFIGMILIQSVLVSAFMLLFGEENSTLVVSIAEVVLRVLQCMFWVYIYRVYSMAQASQENL